MEENKREGIFQNRKIPGFKEEGNLVNLRMRAEKEEKESAEDFRRSEENAPQEFSFQAEEKKSAPKKEGVRGKAAASSNILDLMAEWGMYLLTFLMPLFILPCTFEVFEFSKFFLLAFGAAVLFFVWILDSIFVKKQICFSGSLITWSFLAFLAALFISSFFSVDRASSFLGYSGSFSDSFVFYLGLFIYYLLFTSLAAAKGSDRVISRVVNALIASSFLAALASIPFYIYSGTQIPFFGTVLAGFNTASGYFHAFAAYLAAMLFVIMHDLSRAGAKNWKKAFDVIAIILILVNLVIIDWGAAYAVIFVLCTMLMIFGGALRKEGADSSRSEHMILAMMVFSSLFLISSLDITEIMSGRISTGGSSISSFVKGKLNINVQDANSSIQNGFSAKESMGIASASFSSRPILGSGPGTYHYDFFKFKSAGFNYDSNWSMAFNKAYSEILEKVSTAGILGALSYLLLAAMAFLLAVKNARQGRNNEFILAAFLCLLVFQFLFLETALLKFLFVALLSVIASRRIASSKAKDADANKWQVTVFDVDNKKISGGIVSFAGMVVILLCSTSFIAGFQIFRAEAQYTEAVRSASPENLDSGKLEEIIKLNPYKGDYAAGISRIYLSRTYKLAASSGADDQSASSKLAIEASMALAYAQKAVEISPNDLYLWENYGFVSKSLSDLKMQGGEDLAIKAYETAAALAPNDPVISNEIGKVYLAKYERSESEADKKDSLRKAQDRFKKAEDLKNNYPEAALNLSLAYYDGNDKKKALEEVDKAGMMAGSLSIESAVEVGRMYFNLGEDEKAKNMLGSIISADAGNANARYILASIYKKEKNYDKALEEFNKVAENNGDNETLKKDIEEVQKLMGKSGSGDNAGDAEKTSSVPGNSGDSARGEEEGSGDNE